MRDTELLRQLQLALTGRAIRIKELEQDNARLRMELVKVKSELVAAPLNKDKEKLT